ncbi:MAG: hypothetical protein D8M57_17790 [Candidatus Scalindua sp. AMX11]|nr:MAG: hypothetical protein DWQ00_14250 [Candidatus Scalindua sp.]TDE63523.1 MAG: hypothetical protein D8M57_17790 [Candidatus Scalindua sp. AMX11]
MSNSLSIVFIPTTNWFSVFRARFHQKLRKPFYNGYIKNFLTINCALFPSIFPWVGSYFTVFALYMHQEKIFEICHEEQPLLCI